MNVENMHGEKIKTIFWTVTVAGTS